MSTVIFVLEPAPWYKHSGYLRLFQFFIQSTQSIISQSETPSRITSLCLSILQKEYNDRVAPAARRCAGPTPPFLASSLDLQMHVARLRSSAFGVPNQYLPSVSSSSGRRLGVALLTSRSRRWQLLQRVQPCPRRRGRHIAWSAGSATEMPQCRRKSPSTCVSWPAPVLARGLRSRSS